MPNGLLIKNDNNNVQITSDYLNLQIISKTSVENGQTRGGSNLQAIRPIKGGAPMLIDEPMGAGTIYAIGSDNQSGANIGLQVFTASGKVAYDSSLKNLRVLDRVRLNAPAQGDTNPANSWSKQYLGKDVAVLFMQTIAAAPVVDQNGVSTGKVHISGVSLSNDNTLTVDLTATSADFNAPTQFRGWYVFGKICEFVVIDVTGY